MSSKYEQYEQYYLRESEKDILTEIGYYFERNVDKLGIKFVKYESNVIYLILSRPGILIGKKGRDVDNIMKVFKEMFGSDVKLKMIESDIDTWLHTFEYQEENFTVSFSYSYRQF